MWFTFIFGSISTLGDTEELLNVSDSCSSSLHVSSVDGFVSCEQTVFSIWLGLSVSINGVIFIGLTDTMFIPRSIQLESD